MGAKWTTSDCKDWLTRQGYRFAEWRGKRRKPAGVTIYSQRKGKFVPILARATGPTRSWPKARFWRKICVHLGAEKDEVG